MSKNFRVRLICSLGLFAVALLAMYTFDGIPFRILAVLFVAVAAIELFSFLKSPRLSTTKTAKTAKIAASSTSSASSATHPSSKASKPTTKPATASARTAKITQATTKPAKATPSPTQLFLLLCEFAFLILGVTFVCHLPIADLWFLILGVCGYDIFAYLCGHLFGGKITQRRPFPTISKGKTWEGTALGLVIATALVALLLHFTGSTAYPFLLCAPLALAGDLFESYLKRQFGIKDSNELVVQNPVLDKIEYLVGERQGHGGFLDRIDSMAFTATALLIIFAILP